MVDAGKEGSFMYPMMTSEYASGRPFGLLLTIDYKDTVSYKQFLLLLLPIKT